ncbi:MAG: transposase [Bdellovibrionales bacterium]|nr:transposase [Bdellovibrionales bacterium]
MRKTVSQFMTVSIAVMISFARMKKMKISLSCARCDVKEGKGRGVKSEVRDFAKSLARSKEIIWRIQPGERRISPDLTVRLVKIRNPSSKQDMVFVTNLSASQFSTKEIGKLYRRRWEIETSFKELTCTLKIGQWHSKSLNGILQEIFALLWLVNVTRRQLKIRRELLAVEYENQTSN